MGVIKKDDNERGIVRASSQDSISVAQSDDELSIASVSSVSSLHVRASIRNAPRPTSFTNVRGRMGKKRIRRYENSVQLESLAEETEFHEVKIDDLVQSRNQGFSRLFKGENMEDWYSFMEHSEEVQIKILQHVAERHTSKYSEGQHSAGKEFLRIKTGLRNVLKKSNLPLGMLRYLETEIVTFFSESPKETYISSILSSFERLLLHGVCQYHNLISVSRADTESQARLVHVWNQHDEYIMPKSLLCDYLDKRRNNLQQ